MTVSIHRTFRAVTLKPIFVIGPGEDEAVDHVPCDSWCVLASIQVSAGAGASVYAGPRLKTSTGRFVVAQGLKASGLVRSGYACNNACRFCDQGDWRETRDERSDEEVLQLVDQAVETARAGSGVVVFAGGEVTLRPELPQWIERAREQGARRVLIQTNGRMLAYPRNARKLVSAGADIFAVALHGHIAPLHDWLTRVPGSYEQALKGIENARRAGANVLVNTVITRSNFRHLPEIVALLPRLGVGGIRFIWLRSEGHAEAQIPSLAASPDMVSRYLIRALELARGLKRRVQFEAPEDLAGLEELLHVDPTA